MKLAVLAILATLTFGLVLAACGDGGDGASDSGSPSQLFAQACQKSDTKQFTAPEQTIDTSKTYVATITTEKGDIVVELSNDTPITTNSFVFLACKGFYDGLTFHRVLPGFVAQGGDPTGTGAGGPGYTIQGEFEGAVFDAGVIGMARGQDPNSAGSQFFITLDATHDLDGQYAAFGHVTSGMDVAQQLTPRDPQQNPDAPPGDVMETITIEEQ